jgi:uncharacterized LabA/DUF88 family protein
MGVGAIFVDGANMSRALTARFHEGKGRFLIDYGKLAEVLEKRYGVPFCYRTYYTSHRDDIAAARREPFYSHLRRNGWTVFDHPAKWIVNSDHPEGVWMDKGIDLAIGLDAYRLALQEKNLTVLALATHDADFAQLFKRLPPSIRGVSIGWKGKIAFDLEEVSEPVYLDEIGVLKR